MDRSQATLSLILGILGIALVAAGPAANAPTSADDSLCGCYRAIQTSGGESLRLSCLYDPALGWYGIEEIAADLAESAPANAAVVPSCEEFTWDVSSGDVPIGGWDCLDDCYAYEAAPTAAARVGRIPRSRKPAVQTGSLADLVADIRHSSGSHLAEQLNDPLYSRQAMVLRVDSTRLAKSHDADPLLGLAGLLESIASDVDDLPVTHYVPKQLDGRLVLGIDHRLAEAAPAAVTQPAVQRQPAEVTSARAAGSILVRHLLIGPVRIVGEILLGEPAEPQDIVASRLMRRRSISSDRPADRRIISSGSILGL